ATPDPSVSVNLFNRVIYAGTPEEETIRIVAGLQPIGAPTAADAASRYAWWVGDENSKALIERAPAAATMENAWSYAQAAPAAGFSLEDPATSKPLGISDPRDSKLGRLYGDHSLDLVSSVDDVSIKFFN